MTILLLTLSIPAVSQTEDHTHEDLSLSDSLTLAEIVSAAVEFSSESLMRGVKGEHAAALDSLSRGIIPGQASWQASVLDDRFTDNAGVQEIELGVELGLWHRNERAVTAELGAAYAQRASAYDDYLRWLSAGRVRQALNDLAAAEAIVARANESRIVLASIAETVTKQVQAGELAEAESLRVEAEALELELALVDAQATLVDAQRSYSAITGLDVRPTEIVREVLSPERVPTESKFAISATHPLLKLLALEVELARGNAERTEFTSRNRSTVTIGGRRERAGAMVPTNDTIGIGISVPLGGKKLGRPSIVAAREVAVEAEVDLHRARRRLEQHHHEVEHDLFISDESIALTESRQALAHRRVSMALVAFEEAEIELEQVLRVRRQLNDISRELDLLRIARGGLIAQHKQVVGEVP